MASKVVHAVMAGVLAMFGQQNALAAESTPTEGQDESVKSMRPLSTDRPDVTESPYTVDRGHFQLELDTARYSVDAGTSTLSFANANMKLGLANFWDFQVVVESLLGVEEPAGYNFGFGDIALRSKFNIFGNDEGNVAFGVMPWAKMPTAQSRGNGRVEGGLITLLGVALPADFSTGFMIEIDAMDDELDDDYHLEALTTATLGHPIVGPLSGYVEVFGVYSTEPAATYALSLDGGLTCLLTDYVMIDAGAAFGLTSSAEDLSIFTGFSFKY